MATATPTPNPTPTPAATVAPAAAELTGIELRLVASGFEQPLFDPQLEPVVRHGLDLWVEHRMIDEMP